MFKYKYLGVVMDDCLSWRDHVHHALISIRESWNAKGDYGMIFRCILPISFINPMFYQH